LRAGRVVLATGALEQPLVFRNNDLPGIMHGSAAQRLLRRYGVRPGTRAVILTANDFGYGVALDLAEAQIDVAAIVDLRSTISGGPLRTATIKQNFRMGPSMIVSEAVGRRRVRSVPDRLRPDGAASDESEEINRDPQYVGLRAESALAAHAGALLI
jgi:sarcosine oxidase subunit alpha